MAFGLLVIEYIESGTHKHGSWINHMISLLPCAHSCVSQKDALHCHSVPQHGAQSQSPTNTTIFSPGSAEPYSELGPLYARLRAETESLMQHCRAAGLVVTGALTAGLTVEAASSIAAAVPATVPGEMQSGHERNSWASYLYAVGIHS